jgi:hypothetical protein
MFRDNNSRRSDDESPRPATKAARNAMTQDGGSMPEHKFKIGQSVNFTSGPFGRGAASSIYKVTQLLPPEGDDYQYRIKSASEPHERVVKESQMNRVA